MGAAVMSSKTENPQSTKESPFAAHAWAYIERDMSVIPIAPGSKRPGVWSQADGWRGMPEWTRFAKRLPTEIELEHWNNWPGANFGLVLGPASKIVAIDRDYDFKGGDALDAIIPWSPCIKKGQKGWCRFYYDPTGKIASTSFDVGGARVLDILADGRQTVMPPSTHPSGCNYVWLSEETLETLSPSDLPQLPDDFLEQVARVLAPYQTEQDRTHQKVVKLHKDSDSRIQTDLTIQQEYFRDINRIALEQLDQWVPKLLKQYRQDKEGYRARATWRNAENFNVGIHPAGIRDWGGGYAMTALDIVMYANGLPFDKAVEVLRDCLTMPAQDVITFGAPASSPSAPTKPATTKPAALPWQRPSTHQAPAPVVLPPTTSDLPSKAIPNFVLNPPGMLGEISRWITATAPKSQPELSVASALAIGSACMQRVWRSNRGNHPSLYIVMVAKSTEGKDHPQMCVERVLTAADLGHLVVGSGYTSAGAVFSALLQQPAHLAIVDELGKMLKTSRAKGNSHGEAAIDKLVEAYGRNEGVMRPPIYSTMTLKANQIAPQRMIHNPCISLLGATTPGTFFKNLVDDMIEGGLIGRLLVIESSQPRQLSRQVDQTPPPDSIVDWCRAVRNPAALKSMGNLSDLCSPDMPATTVGMVFDDACDEMLTAFEIEINHYKDAPESEEGLDVILGRTREKAMRLAMIACKGEDPAATQIKPAHLQWAIDFCRYYDLALQRAVLRHRVVSQADEDMKRMIAFVKSCRKYGDSKHPEIYNAGGMPWSKLLKLMKMPSRQFTELANTVIEAGLLNKSPGTPWNYAGFVLFPGDGD